MAQEFVFEYKASFILIIKLSQTISANCVAAVSQ